MEYRSRSSDLDTVEGVRVGEKGVGRERREGKEKEREGRGGKEGREGGEGGREEGGRGRGYDKWRS